MTNNIPEYYILNREEWLAVNRALASARLGIPNTKENLKWREIVKEAQDVLSKAYGRVRRNVR